MKFMRSRYILQNYRELQRRFEELSALSDRMTEHRSRAKRNVHTFDILPSQYHHFIYPHHKNIVHRRVSRNLNNFIHRQLRRPFQGEEAYAKYMETIRQKYQKYVKNILGYNNIQNYSSEISRRPFDNHESLTRLHPSQTQNNVNHYHRYDSANSFVNTKPTVASYNFANTDNKENRNDPFPDNGYFGEEHNENQRNQYRIVNNNFVSSDNIREDIDYSIKPNMTELIAKLKSQIIRRKRNVDSNVENEKRNRKFRKRANSNQTVSPVDGTEIDENLEGLKRGKAKGPCEPLPSEPYMRIDIIREGRDPTHEYSAGTMVKVTCAKEYKLNLQNPNGTAKCVRSRWKPMKPLCTLLPCSVPSTEHGSFYTVTTDVSTPNAKPTPKMLNAFDEILNGDIIDVQCDDGYNVQGTNQLKCWQGNWDTSNMPECLPAPCILPNIANAVYQGGYRGGLTIAHGSSVSVQCENVANNLPVQMVCALGSLSPKTIQCGTGARRSREEYLSEVEFVNTREDMNAVISGLSSGAKVAETSVQRTGNLEAGKDCGTPRRVDDALVYRNGDLLGDMDDGFQSGTEITFNCIASSAGERTTWKIICEDGQWVGRSLNCANGTCIFRNNEPNVVSFYNDLEVRSEEVEFPPGATIVSRCTDIGKFAMTGSNVRQCIHSEWNGQKPTCFGLNQENDYAMEKAPTILFRHSNGPIAQSNDGKLIVYPGTTVHMECLWMRRFGNPKWVVSHEYRVYPEGWVTDDTRDATLEYRLSIIHAVEDDSGSFTCQTPARHGHKIDIVVKAINCAKIPVRRGLTMNTNETKMSVRVQLSCANGNSLIGASELVCLPSGNWSAPLPVCESVECGDLPITASSNRSVPRVAVLSREVGGRAAFSCRSGYGIRGPSESICLPSGEWSLPFPDCVEMKFLEVQCDNPGAPANGYAQGSAPYRAGDVVQFNCNPGYMMQGQPIIACQDSGRWSGILPKCVQACSYPGTAIAGRMSSVKFYYTIGENITFTCDAGLSLRGAVVLKCLPNGKWSNAIPTCVASEQSARGDN